MKQIELNWRPTEIQKCTHLYNWVLI